jgi:hypothetical protein
MAIGFVSGSGNLSNGDSNMQDERWIFIKTKFDTICCVFLIIGFVAVMMWADVHSSDKFLSWLEQSATTILGTYLGIIQPWKNKNGGSGNGSTTSSSTTTDGSSTVTSSVTK